MNKKGDLSINIIVIAAIALLVLIVLAVLILRTGSGIDRGVSCENLGGNCKSDCSIEYGEFIDQSGRCPIGEVCCRTLQPTE